MLSFVDAVVLRAVPYPNADSLVEIALVDPQGRNRAVSSEVAMFWRESTPLEEVEGDRWTFRTITGIEEPTSQQGVFVTSHLFDLLGIDAALGRAFSSSDYLPGAEPTVVVSDRFWRSHLGGQPDNLGKTLYLDGRPHTLIGVLADRAYTPTGGDHAFYLPLHLERGEERGAGGLRSTVSVYARLGEGAELDQTRLDLNGLTRSYLSERDPAVASWGVSITPVSQKITERWRGSLPALVAAVVFVFLLTCGNVGQILLARAIARRPDYAVQSALGASRGRLFLGSLIESALIALLASGVGLTMTFYGIQFLRRNPDLFGSAKYQQPELNLLVLLGTVVAASASVLIAGSGPAIRSIRGDISRGLRSRRTLVDRGNAGAWLVSVEACLTTVLLVGATLLFGSFRNLQQVDLGFEPSNVLTARVPAPAFKYGSAAQAVSFLEGALLELGRLPGVEEAAFVAPAPFGEIDATVTVRDFSVEAESGEPLLVAHLQVVSPDYFRALAIPLRMGRGFGVGDHAGSPAAAIVNETLSNSLWPGQNAIGKKLATGRSARDAGLTIVGVVGDVVDQHFGTKPRLDLYRPYLQQPDVGQMAAVVVRTRGDPSGTARGLRAAIRTVDADVPVMGLSTMEAVVERLSQGRRSFLALAEMFALVGLLLAAAGVYGTLSHWAQSRTREIGIRMALGSGPLDVLRFVLSRALLWSVIGAAVGVAVAAGLIDLVQSQLFGMGGREPWAYALSLALVGSMAVAAAYPVARRAARTDPIAILREG